MIVMKFGGTSVADAAAMTRSIGIVEGKLKQKPIVVVSACAKVTDSLYGILELVAAGKKEEALKITEGLKQRHLTTAEELGAGEEGAAVVLARTSWMSDFIEKHCGSPVSDMDKAHFISMGEYMSSGIMCHGMNARGIKTTWIDARRMVITDSEHMCGTPDMDKLTVATKAVIDAEYKDVDAVITQGFISSTADGEPSILGRGGSDYSASLIGASVDAARIEIWTDVDGVRTADPRIVENTVGISKLSYEEAAELAYLGAKVLHPLTMEPAVPKSIPLFVLNSMNPSSEGTAVMSKSCIFDGVKSISYKENIKVISIYSLKMIDTPGFMMKVFSVFANDGVSVDLISSSEASITVTVDKNQVIDKVVEDLSAFATVRVNDDKSQISLVGKNIIGVRGLLSKTFGALVDHKIYMISQGATYLNLSVVVDRPELRTALCRLHKAFFEN